MSFKAHDGALGVFICEMGTAGALSCGVPQQLEAFLLMMLPFKHI